MPKWHLSNSASDPRAPAGMPSAFSKLARTSFSNCTHALTLLKAPLSYSLFYTLSSTNLEMYSFARSPSCVGSYGGGGGIHGAWHRSTYRPPLGTFISAKKFCHTILVRIQHCYSSCRGHQTCGQRFYVLLSSLSSS